MKEMEKSTCGFLLVDKREGSTSIAVDRKAKALFRTRRVGHLGTLDPFATGLLIVAIGEATKFLPLLDDRWKSYRATLQLGFETTTYDKTGDLVSQVPLPSLDASKIQEVLQSFIGISYQQPPIFSAKRIDGKRAYDLARSGQEVHLAPQEVVIDCLTLEKYDPRKGTLQFSAVVSKGTYLRTLGVDIARRLGTLGTLTALRRTQVGPYRVERAVDIDAATADDLLPLEEILPSCENAALRGELLRRAKNGHLLPPLSTKDFLLVRDEDGRDVALYRRTADGYACYRGFSHG